MTNERKEGVLITGGSGMIGSNLTPALLSTGYNVAHLSRTLKPATNNFKPPSQTSPGGEGAMTAPASWDQKGGKPDTRTHGEIATYSWDPGKGILDPAVFTGIDHVIHLAGANIGEKRWSDRRKKELRESRIDSAKLIHKIIKENNLKIKTFISASGISYYGTRTSERIFREDDPPADDFLGNLCREWEEAADLFATDGIRTVKIRTAVTLEKNDLALKRMTFPAKFGFMGMAGSGKQFLPWIHNQDICGIYLKALMDEKMNGAYNATAPVHTAHKEFMRTLAKVLKKPFFPVPAPAMALKIVYGEMAGIVLEGSRVSSQKITDAGYRFRFDSLENALKDIYKNLENNQEVRNSNAR